MTGVIFTNDGNKVAINRLFKSSPDYLAPSLISVGTGTTDPTVSDTTLQTQVELTSGVEYASFSSGYPVLDETNLQATIRAFINTLQANGNDLTEFGISNADTTKKMLLRAVHTAIAKTNVIEVSYVSKMKY